MRNARSGVDSPGNTITAIVDTAGTAYCVTATNPKGTNTGSAATVYVSSKGGLQPIGTTVCPGVGASSQHRSARTKTSGRRNHG